MPLADSQIPLAVVPSQHPLRRLVLAILRIAIGAGLLVWLAKSGIIDFRELSKLFTAWPITLAAVALLLFDIAFMSLRLRWLFRVQDLQLSFGDSAKLTLISFFFGTFLPGAAGGDIAKIFYAVRGNASRRTEIITVALLDRAFGLFSLLLLPLIFAPMFLDLLRAVPALRILLYLVAWLALAILLAFFLCLSNRQSVKSLLHYLLGIIPWRAQSDRMMETIRAYRRFPGVLFAALAASLAANLFLVGVTALAVMLLDPAALSAGLCLVIPLGHVINAVPLTPGGLGVGEAAFNALFKIAGLTGGAEVLLSWRVWNTLVSLFGLGFYVRGLGAPFSIAAPSRMANLRAKHMHRAKPAACR
ncbi:MAG: lysylphosphatidylglycerol synthase transmembrane domain-containing protein [Candidatus Acidiferrales bacterium]